MEDYEAKWRAEVHAREQCHARHLAAEATLTQAEARGRAEVVAKVQAVLDTTPVSTTARNRLYQVIEESS